MNGLSNKGEKSFVLYLMEKSGSFIFLPLLKVS